ncbi:MAG TPA: hypothetical protein VFC46_11630 [Humisphaera sp.]|nr:hypothetical protein [Humisphaera sp.]
MEEKRPRTLDYGAPNLEHDKEERTKRIRDLWIGSLTSVGGLLLMISLYWIFRKWM